MIETIKCVLCAIVKYLNNPGRDIVLLAVRISMLFIFFRSGLLKLEDWESTLFLFELEYAVPILPYSLTAVLAMVFELTMPLLILLGLGTRLACVPLLSMAVVIQFVLGSANPAYNQLAHYWWMLLLLMLITHGAGRFSLDSVLCRIYCRKRD